mgnify:FL=1
MKKSKKDPCAQRIGWTAAGILWWMGCDDGSDAELFRNEILNLIQLDLQSGGQLAKEQQLCLFQQGGVIETGLLPPLSPPTLFLVQALGQAGQLEDLRISLLRCF